jgi:hypothetical protein
MPLRINSSYVDNLVISKITLVSTTNVSGSIPTSSYIELIPTASNNVPTLFFNNGIVSSVSASIDNLIIKDTIYSDNGNIYSKYFTAGDSFIGNLTGNADTATTATNAPNYVLNSVTSSMLSSYVRISQTSSLSVSTASYVTNLNQNLIISGAIILSSSTQPTPIIGGIYFDGNDFYLGF